MADNENRKVLLSLRNVSVKFNVRGRILTAIRNVSLDILEHESIAIVGESGSGKSVLTKTFAGMLENNGFISEGSIIFSDDELSVTTVPLTKRNKRTLALIQKKLDAYSKLERGAEEYNAYNAKLEEIRHLKSLSGAEEEEQKSELKKLGDALVETQNYLLTLDRHSQNDAGEIAKCTDKIRSLKAQQDDVRAKWDRIESERLAAYNKDTAKKQADANTLKTLKNRMQEKVSAGTVLSNEVVERNRILSYEIMLSIGRYPYLSQLKLIYKLMKAFKQAMRKGEDLNDSEIRRRIFETTLLYVEFRNLNEAQQQLEGWAVIDCAQVKYTKDWQQIRGRRIATVFQDPMTSLNPVVTIGKQIMSVVLKHQNCSQAEAKRRTIEIMGKVGIPDPEKRFDDYPFQYSGGMRQRIVIAIALSCHPEILICDEPTTALDVTIQAQIIALIRSLQKELKFTTLYITHDLGVVANVADRVGVMYGGQIIEYGTVNEIFYEPQHPYTWALLSALPQLSEKGQDLYYITGTPPSLYNEIKGDAFAPRNPNALKIDFVKEPPFFQVSPTHFAKTWLLDPRAPKIEKPAVIQNLHEKIAKMTAKGGAFHVRTE